MLWNLERFSLARFRLSVSLPAFVWKGLQMAQVTNPVLSKECPHGAYESEHEDGACPCFPGVVVNPVPSEAELDALVERLPQNCQCYQRPTFADPPCDVCKAAAAITALRKREVTEAMVVAAARKYRPRVGMSFAAHCKFMRDALQAAFAQAEAEKP